jgi:ankyrin repeat protein
VAALLKAGADPNAGVTFGLGLLVLGTPLSEAVKNNHTEVLAALLKAGATPMETQ